MQVNIGHFVAHRQEVLTLLLPLSYGIGGEEHQVFVEVKLDNSHADFERVSQLLAEIEAKFLAETVVAELADQVYELIDSLPQLAADIQQQRDLLLLEHYRDCLD